MISGAHNGGWLAQWLHGGSDGFPRVEMVVFTYNKYNKYELRTFKIAGWPNMNGLIV